MIKNLLCILLSSTLCASLQAQYVSTPVNVDSRTLNTSYKVGSIAGSLTVSPSGHSNYQIPIEVPPGVNGLVPKLSVNYNSGSSNGLLGYGANLTGISFISRGSNSFMQDGNSKKVDFNTSDALYLGGNRLILVSGTYGVANSEYRLDNSNRVRIKLYGSGTSIYFKVWMPNGRIYLYGTDTNSRLSGSSGILRWYVKSISDYEGNSINYSYTTDTYGFRINQISYAGNTLVFEYVSRDDKITHYFAGVELKQHKILNKIRVNGQGSRFREYQFTYYKDKYSYLNEVKLLGTDGTQINSTVLNWGEPTDYSKYSTAVNKNSYRREYGDFNGDGRMDYLEYPNKSSYSSTDKYTVRLSNEDGKGETKIYEGNLSNRFAGFQVADINGDGKDDVFAPNYWTLGAMGGFYYLDYGYVENGNFVVKSPYGEYETNNVCQFLYADIDGDREKDLIVYEKSNSYLNFVEVMGKSTRGLPRISSSDELSSIQFNNNNSDEILILTSSKILIYECIGNKFIKCYESSIINRYDEYEMCDFNGDGIDDIFNISDNKLYYGTGTGYSLGTSPVSWPDYAHEIYYKKVLSGDFNGDGLSDIYQLCIYEDFDVEAEVTIHYGIGGKGFISKIKTDMSPIEYPLTIHNIPEIQDVKIADFNGDNNDDVILSHNKASTYQKTLSNDSGNENLLVKVADGMNNKYTITYQRTNDGDVYSQDANTGDANLAYYQGKRKMVKGIRMTSDGTSVSNTTYSYKNQTVHKTYGFLGCKEYSQKESVQNAERTSVFEFIGDYYVGALNSSSNKLSGTLLSSSNSTNAVAKLNGSGNKGFSLISYKTGQSQTDHLRGISNSVSYSGFDSYYYPRSISKNLGGALTDNQAISYSHLVNSNYWVLGRPAEIIETKDHVDNAAISTTTKWSYTNHQLSTKTQLYGTPKAVTETYVYSSGKVSSVSLSGSGVTSRSTSFLYDASKRFVTQETNALGHVSKATYDPVTGNQRTATDPNNRVTSFTYNGFGELLRSNFADGTNQSNSLTWNASISGSVYKASSTLSGRAPVSTYYDRLGRAIRSEGLGYNSKRIKTDTRYDSKGRVAAVSLPFSSTKTAEKTYTYDSYGRPSNIILPNGRGSVSYSYNGLTTKEINPESWKEITIDGAGFVKSAKDPGGEITYAYYSNGLVEAITFGQHVIHHVYDQQGNAIQTTDPDAGTTSAVYDAFGQVISSTTANNKTYSYAYDKLGRITTRTLQSGGESTQWQYDPSGNKGAINQILLNSKVVESATYDGYGRTSTQTEKIQDGGITKTYTKSYAYNSNSQVSRMTYPTGYYVDHTYNSDGLLTEIRDRNNKLIWNNPVSNDMGQFTSYSYGNGAVNSRTYDSWYQPDKITAKVGSRVLNNWDFDIDVKGNLAMRKDILHGNQTENFTYDGLNRLTTSSNGSDVAYTPDNTGNLLTKSDVGTYEYKHSLKKHAVTAINKPASTYQASNESVTYTAFNKVNDIEQTLNGLTKKIEFSYGTSYARKMSSVFESGVKKETTYYSGNYEVKKDQASGSEKHYHYISAPSGAAAIFISSGGTTGNLYFIHTDYLGSIVALSNQSGYLAEQYAYDAWGNRRTPSDWSLADNRTDLLIDRGYTMHEHITGFGLVNMNGRVYDPKLGRFLSPDPVLQDASNTQNMNRYSYVWNNPLKYVDPSGYYNQAAVASDNGGEEGGGSSGSTNWYGTVGSSGRMGWNLGTIYNAGGLINYTGGLFGQEHTNINGTWVSSGDVKRYSGSSAGQAFSLIRSAHQYGRALSATMAQFRMSASFDNGSVYTITAGNGMYTISNLDVSVLGAAQSNGDGRMGVNVYIETDGIGHVYAEVNGTVFSYGRYDGSFSPSSGRYGPVGPGIMMRYKGREAQEFIKKRTGKYPTSIYNITDVNAKSAYNYWNNMYWSGEENASGGRHVNTYFLVGVGTNCATMTGNGLRQGGFFLNNAHTPWEMESQFNWYNGVR